MLKDEVELHLLNLLSFPSIILPRACLISPYLQYVHYCLHYFPCLRLISWSICCPVARVILLKVTYLMTLLSWAGIKSSFVSHANMLTLLERPLLFNTDPILTSPTTTQPRWHPFTRLHPHTPQSTLRTSCLLMCSYCRTSIPFPLVMSCCSILVGFPAQTPSDKPSFCHHPYSCSLSSAPGAVSCTQCKLLHNSWAPAHTNAHRYEWKFRQSFPFYLLYGPIHWPVGLQFGKLSFH